jgi:hypothetical protein
LLHLQRESQNPSRLFRLIFLGINLEKVSVPYLHMPPSLRLRPALQTNSAQFCGKLGLASGSSSTHCLLPSVPPPRMFLIRKDIRCSTRTFSRSMSTYGPGRLLFGTIAALLPSSLLRSSISLRLQETTEHRYISLLVPTTTRFMSYSLLVTGSRMVEELSRSSGIFSTVLTPGLLSSGSGDKKRLGSVSRSPWPQDGAFPSLESSFHYLRTKFRLF